MALLSPSSVVSVSADQRTAYWHADGRTWSAPMNADGSLGDKRPTSVPEIESGLTDLPQMPDAPGWPVPGQPVVLFPATDPAADGVFWISPIGAGLAYASRLVAEAAAETASVETTLPKVLAASTDWLTHHLAYDVEPDAAPAVPALLPLPDQGDHLDVHVLLAAVREIDPRSVPQFVVQSALNNATSWRHDTLAATVEILPKPAELYVTTQGATWRFSLDGTPWNAQRCADEGKPQHVWDVTRPLVEMLGLTREPASRAE